MKLQRNLIRLVLASLALLLISQAAMAADLDGKWNFTFYSDEGEHPREFVLTQKGSEVEAKLGEEPFTGTFKNGELTMEGDHYVDEAGYKSLMKIFGKLADGKLKGTASWDTYDLTFTATKAD
jgi:hypothetical protein